MELPVDQAALEAAGSGLGTASILVLDAATSFYSIVQSVARFFERESCGQCPPCVLGSTNLRQLVTGTGPATQRLTPRAALQETAFFMSMHGYCAHGRSGAAVVTRLFDRWSGPILERLRSGSPIAGTRDRDPFASDSPERRALDLFLARV
jgi:NADH-quinone oxidoreductase subunit F